MAEDVLFTIDGLEFKVTTPDRVFYPSTGTTKLDVIGYYAAVAEAMLPHVQGRPATRKRWPDGVDHPAFFVKDLQPGSPAWLSRTQIPHKSGPKFYPVFDSPAALAWLGQVAALELHVPQWQIEQPTGPTPAVRSVDRSPDRVVFDLDPGPGAGLAECVDVAHALRERLGRLGERMVPVTSGSKGLHLYVPMDEPITTHQASQWARLAAEELEKANPGLVVSRMAKSLRTGKVLIDWSQNNRAKTTIAPYSLRGREQPTVAAPRTWAELAEPGLRHLDYREVLERLTAGIDPLVGLHHPGTTAGDPRTGPMARPVVRVRARRTPAARRPAPPAAPETETGGLPADLARGAVQLELAKAVPTLPGPHAMPGGTRWELKWDGFRASVVRATDTVRIWSRNGTDMTDSFPEIVSAAMLLLPLDSICDGELVAWDSDRLSFDLLQQRLAAGPARARSLAARHPASYVVFDVLAAGGTDLRSRPFDERRAALEALAPWAPPMQVSPLTADIATARTWLSLYAPAGIEGLVAKGGSTTYRGGSRGWAKFKHRTTEEAIIGAVIGPISHPESIVVGRYTNDGHLVMVGRSVPLSCAQSASLAAVLEPTRPGHPWPDTVLSSRFGNARDRVALTKVKPTVVAEVSADTAQQSGVWRHGVRFLRHRPELHPTDVPTLPAHAQTAG